MRMFIILQCILYIYIYTVIPTSKLKIQCFVIYIYTAVAKTLLYTILSVNAAAISHVHSI